MSLKHKSDILYIFCSRTSAILLNIGMTHRNETSFTYNKGSKLLALQVSFSDHFSGKYGVHAQGLPLINSFHILIMQVYVVLSQPK